jgi:hypothetical protein
VEPFPPLDPDRLRKTAPIEPWRTVPFWLLIIVALVALIAGVVLGATW